MCVQNKDGDAACPGTQTGKVRTITLSNEDAKGPCYARFLISTLYRKEDYCLSVDCHTNFVQNWDELCISMIKKCPHPSKSVITSHPPQQYTDPSKERTTHICKGKFNNKTVAFESIEVPARTKNMPTPFLGWGFIFMPGKVLLDVKLDPDLDFLFEGEELLYAARLWTHGYDLFSPAMSVCSHNYKKEKDPNVYTDNSTWGEQQSLSIEKMRRILDGVSHYYGLGNARSLSKYLKHAKIDMKKKTIGEHCV